MLKKRLQLMMTGKMLKRLQLMTALTVLMLTLIIASVLLSEPQFKLCIVLTLMCAAYVEYHRRKLVVSWRYTDKKLKEQARRFHSELWMIIHFKPWGDEELETLMGLQAEFRQIHPSDRYGTTNMKYVLSKE